MLSHHENLINHICPLNNSHATGKWDQMFRKCSTCQCSSVCIIPFVCIIHRWMFRLVSSINALFGRIQSIEAICTMIALRIEYNIPKRSQKIY